MPGAFAHMIAAEEAGRKIEDRALTLPMRAVNRYPQWLQAGASLFKYPGCFISGITTGGSHH